MVKNLPKETLSNEDPLHYYTLFEKLGEGSYGSVWKAIDNSTGAQVAIKKVAIENDLEDMKREINFMKQCQSPYIVTYHASFKKDNEVWIVMEFCGAGSVCDAMKITNKTLTEDQISVVSRDVLQGLAYLHSVRKIHRDIKAGNILMNLNGESKLADFGVSSQLDTMAKRQTVIGTPFWMAPEVIQEVGYDYKADIWSFGITCIEMAESKPPLFNVHPMRVIFMIPNPSRPPPKLSEPEKWSSDFNDFIAKCLTRKPELRPSAEELLKHPFITRPKLNHSILTPLIDEQSEIIEIKGREVALGLDPKDDEDEEDESDGSDDSDDRTGTVAMKPGFRNNRNQDDDEDEEEFDSGTMVITDNQPYGTVVLTDEDKSKFVPAYMNQFKKENESSKYQTYSLDELKKTLEALEIEQKKEIQAINEKYSTTRQSLISVIEEKRK
ncbi:protein serine/threonine kinase [Tieghemostelium lacteum]|uniref:non-specific serine/threonine protein kinase n=1 Tax=Tieghemostelium lacteum TaxID=361077 RepID=A0A151ZSC9_TIELA|nr:protein serine/threonine kinase [Tieghemostelium lacteum]|eukprot:KYQ96897.1 protein serine/threonine kinase [Tieghemostelium lacteum]